MNSFIFLLAFSLANTMSLYINYKTKETLKNHYNRIYSMLMQTCLGAILLEIGCHVAVRYLNPENMISQFIFKGYIAALIIWVLIYWMYIFMIGKDGESEDVREVLYKKIGLITRIMGTILTTMCFVLPIRLVEPGGYTDGPAIYLMGFIYLIVVFIATIDIIKNSNKLRNTKYVPIITFVISIGVLTVVLLMNRSWLVATAFLSFLLALMYHYIENPDIKMLDEMMILKEQAEKANSYKTDFLSSMSHEIRTPLNAIVGFSHALADEDISATAKEEVKDIIAASDILLDIVNGILDISKIEAGKLEIINNEYNPNRLLNDLIPLIKARMGDKDLDFRVSLDPSIPNTLYGDSSHLKQVLINILTNAVKYTKEGFVEFSVNSFIKGDICRLIIGVEDSGTGIKPENIKKLFDKFERLGAGNTSSIEGTGLGLAITQKLVELMGGEIVVQSVYGQGSKFTVAINQRIVEVAASPEPENEELHNTQLLQSVDLSDKKVLVVDDNKMNLKVAARLLSTFNLQIETVESGQECIDKINAKEHYDLILLDDMMPKMSGIETLKILRNDAEFKIPVVALTANAISGMREKYLEAGFNDYLAKPIEKPELYRVLFEYLSNNK